LFRAGLEDSEFRASVLLDAGKRPAAFWDRQTKLEDSIISGFYKWQDSADNMPFPEKALTVYAEPDGGYAIMYQITRVTLDREDIVPLLVLQSVSRVVDARGDVPKSIRGELPEFLSELVKIEED
jgi:hypothetical protein